MSTKIRRSLIEVPGNIERMMKKSRAFETDILMLDLEDSVPATDEAKIEARAGIAAALEEGGFVARELAIRVNRPGSPWFLDDAKFAVDVGISTVVLPKAYSGDEVFFAEHYLQLVGASSDLSLILIVETPGVLLDLKSIASKSTMIDGVLSGGFDYTLETGSFSLLAGSEGHLDDTHLVYNRQYVLAVARSKGWTAQDGLLIADPKDLDDARAAAKRSRQLGYDGCGLYYPPHVDIVNKVFAPSAEELEWAEGVVSAYRASAAEGRAALYLNGRAVLPQHQKLATHLIERAKALGMEVAG